MEIETGKVYLIEHSRRGKFYLDVIDIKDDWVTGIILSGNAKTILEYNEKQTGEEITIRKSLCTFTRMNIERVSA